MTFQQFIDQYWPTILAGLLGVLLKEYIIKFLKWLWEALLWLFGVFGIHVLLLRRFKKSLLAEFQETRIGYRHYRIDLERNYISLSLNQEEFSSPHDKAMATPGKSAGIDAVELLSRDKNRYTVILGHPGTGKTTLLQHLLLRYASNKTFVNLIPIYIPLRDLKEQTFEEYMKFFFKTHRFPQFGFIKRKLKRGKCLVMFDGLDEVAKEERTRLLKQIEQFSTEFTKNQIIVTSRIEGYIQNILPAKFHEYEILELDEKTRQNFIYGIVEKDKEPSRLIEQIESNVALQRLAVRPMTLALLTFVYQESPDKSLPRNRLKVYDKCIDLMFEDRDKARGIYEYRNKYETEVKKQILRKISLAFMLANKQSFSKDELTHQIKKAIEETGLPQIDIPELIKELAEANGIFRGRTKDEYDFAHLTFQEYFAALAIPALSDAEREEVIEENLTQDSWKEVFLFYVQSCEQPGKLIEKAWNLKNVWFLGELALNGIARLSDELCSKVLKKIFESFSGDIKRFEPYQIEIIDHLSKNGIEINSGKQLQAAIYVRNQNRTLNIKEWDKRFHIIARENIDGEHPQMVFIPKGEFLYQEKQTLNLSDFWIGLYPVSNGDFKEFIEDIGLTNLNAQFQVNWDKEQTRPYHPVRFITWYEAGRYCNWLSQKHGLELCYDEQKIKFLLDKNGFRLPTEQEWEKAAGWDAFENKARIYPWGDEFRADYCNNSVEKKSGDTSDVRKYNDGRSFYGCYDMAGNVWEWTASWWDSSKGSTVVRGGSWYHDNTGNFRCPYRSSFNPDVRDDYVGFRLVCSAQSVDLGI